MYNSARFKQSLLLFTSFLLLAFINPAVADSRDKKLKIAVGAYTLTRYDSTISASSQSAGLEVGIDPEDALDLENDETVVRFDGYYRFNDRHAITFSSYRIESDGQRIMSDELDWVDEAGNPVTIPIGTHVESRLTYDIHQVGYSWNFYTSDKVDLSIGAGLHMSRVKLKLDAETTNTGERAESANTQLPLPVFSAGITYQVTDKLSWHLNTKFFSISLENNLDGAFSDSNAAIEYLVTDHLALGVGLGNNSLKLIDEEDDFKFTFDNRITGVQLYLAGYF